MVRTDADTRSIRVFCPPLCDFPLQINCSFYPDRFPFVVFFFLLAVLQTFCRRTALESLSFLYRLSFLQPSGYGTPVFDFPAPLALPRRSRWRCSARTPRLLAFLRPPWPLVVLCPLSEATELIVTFSWFSGEHDLLAGMVLVDYFPCYALFFALSVAFFLILMEMERRAQLIGPAPSIRSSRTRGKFPRGPQPGLHLSSGELDRM